MFWGRDAFIPAAARTQACIVCGMETTGVEGERGKTRKDPWRRRGDEENPSTPGWRTPRNGRRWAPGRDRAPLNINASQPGRQQAPFWGRARRKVGTPRGRAGTLFSGAAKKGRDGSKGKRGAALRRLIDALTSSTNAPGLQWGLPSCGDGMCGKREERRRRRSVERRKGRGGPLRRCE